VASRAAPGERLAEKSTVELAAGFAEITFDSGARVTSKPRAARGHVGVDGTLHRGTLKASVPREAIGFRISNPAVEVVDLGTEFTMIATARAPGGARAQRRGRGRAARDRRQETICSAPRNRAASRRRASAM